MVSRLAIVVAPLVATAILAPSAGQAQAHADRATVASWAATIAEASARFGVPEQWIIEVMRAESRGRAWRADGGPLTSPAGAIGPMQVMPATYAALAQAYALGPDPAVPRDNILAGTAYLRLLYDQFGTPGFLAAYNAGPGRYAASLATGRALPGETRAYVARISARLDMASPARPLSPPGDVSTPAPPSVFASASGSDRRLFFQVRGAPISGADRSDLEVQKQ